jgi:hypothetical protein
VDDGGRASRLTAPPAGLGPADAVLSDGDFRQSLTKQVQALDGQVQALDGQLHALDRGRAAGPARVTRGGADSVATVDGESSSARAICSLYSRA